MDSTQRFRINTPTVVHETIDGEVVIINLDNGNYYSLDGSGATVWGYVEKGASLEEIVGQVTNHYNTDASQIEAGIGAFLVELERDELIVTTGTRPEGSGHLTMPDSGKMLRFEAPVLNRYTDMQDLLLLDPIHDVDETGWPALPPDTLPE